MLATLFFVAKWGLITVTAFVAYVAYRIAMQLEANKVRYSVHNGGIVLITGASTGIGQHAALSIAKKFSSVIVLAGVRKTTDADTIKRFGISNLRPIMIDVAKQESCREAIKEVESICSSESLPFIALVNNAGLARRYPAELHDIVDAQAIFATNFWGAFYLTQLVLPLLRESKGRIISISSIAEFTGTPMNSIYVASKTAMGGWSDALRREIAHFGVSVSIIQPAYIKTAIFDTAKGAAAAMDAKSTHSSQAAESPDANSSALLHQHYAHYFNATALQALEEEIRRDASDPDVVTEAVEHALFDSYPKTRYAVGRVAGVPAWACAWIRWALDDRAVDKLITPVP